MLGLYAVFLEHTENDNIKLKTFYMGDAFVLNMHVLCCLGVVLV